MSRIGFLVCRRLAARIGLVIGLFFGILLLVEFLDTGRFARTTELAGPWVSTGLSIMSALRWSLLGLPVTVLIGAVVALIELQTHREMVIINASGLSVWRVLRWPLVMVIGLGAVSATVLDAGAIRIYQQLDAAQIGWGRAYGIQNRATWFSQTGPEGDFTLHARTVLANGTDLREVSVFRLRAAGQNGTRLYADRATLEGRAWVLEDVTVLDVDGRPRQVGRITLPTTSTQSQLALQLGTVENLSFFALLGTLAQGIDDPVAEAAARTRLNKLIALPAVLAGSLLIAFAFTAGYRRGGHYGLAVFYGISLGLIVFMTIEMADRAGTAGVLDPRVAAWGPAIAALAIGLTLLLRREDGRV